MRPHRLLLLMLATGLVALAGMGVAAAQDRTSPSGSLQLDAHTLDYQVGGVQEPPDDPAFESFDGVIAQGDTITFSGATSYSLPDGLCTGLRMGAYVGGWGIPEQVDDAWVSPQEPTPEHNFCGDADASFDFSLSADLPSVPDEELPSDPEAASQPLGTIFMAAENTACGVGGVCGGVDVDLAIAVVADLPGGVNPLIPLGAAGALVAVAGIATARRRRGSDDTQYVLQVDQAQLQVLPGLPATLSARVWRVDAQGRSSPAGEAVVTVTAPPPLTAVPPTGQGAISTAISLSGPPPAPNGAVTVSAAADGTVQQQVVPVNLQADYEAEIT